MSYVAMEILEDANQYKCESCNKHVDALKVCFKNQHMNHHKLPHRHHHFPYRYYHDQHHYQHQNQQQHRHKHYHRHHHQQQHYHCSTN